jgi:arabinofuranosyltransferase
MAGLFVAAPFFLAVVVLCRAPLPTAWAARVSIVLAVVIGRAALAAVPLEISREHGITDQRRLYGDSTRLIMQGRARVEDGTESRRGLQFRDKGPRVAEWGMIGMVGFYAGPTVHLVDRFALADPLLARLPANPDSRIGHFERRVPPGYIASIRSGKNQIAYARIARYYDDLLLITRGPIWSWARWRAIVRLNVFERTL